MRVIKNIVGGKKRKDRVSRLQISGQEESVSSVVKGSGWVGKDNKKRTFYGKY